MNIYKSKFIQSLTDKILNSHTIVYTQNIFLTKKKKKKKKKRRFDYNTTDFF